MLSYLEYPVISVGLLLLPTIYCISPSFDLFQTRPPCKNLPPIVDIPELELIRNPRHAYEQALAEHGPVIRVKRRGRFECIVDRSVTNVVLTKNETFSTEQGISSVLNFSYFHRYFAAYFTVLDDLVRNVIGARLPTVTEKVSPVFFRVGSEVKNELCPEDKIPDRDTTNYIDAELISLRAISEVMCLVILGEDFVSRRNVEGIEHIACDLATAFGIYQNRSSWGVAHPGLWRALAWVRVLTTTIPTFYMTIGAQIWRYLKSRKDKAMSLEESKECALDYLIHNAVEKNEKIGFLFFMKICSLVQGIIFASVHQTACIYVWVLYELIIRPDYMKEIREEMDNLINIDNTSDKVTYNSLQNAERLDSFIREVLRMKGDTLSVVRVSAYDAPLAGVTIPKGSLVFPLASSSYLNKEYHGPDAGVFDGRRWIGSGKQSSMVSASYFPFGLGRWACPGRTFAIAEIKLLIWGILCQGTPVLRGGSFCVEDPLNVASTAPKGEMTIIPLQS